VKERNTLRYHVQFLRAELERMANTIEQYDEDFLYYYILAVADGLAKLVPRVPDCISMGRPPSITISNRGYDAKND
jgi:hypothetical protein